MANTESIVPDYASMEEDQAAGSKVPDYASMEEEQAAGSKVPDYASMEEEQAAGSKVPDYAFMGGDSPNYSLETPDKTKTIIRLSRDTKSKLDEAMKDESFLHTPGGGFLSRGIAYLGEKVGAFDKPNIGINKEDDWYDPKEGVVNFVGLLQSGLPQDKKYAILKDIAKDVYGIPEEQYAKLLPEAMYRQKDDSLVTDIAKTAARSAQQATPFGEDLARMAIRKVRDFPVPEQFAPPQQRQLIKEMMKKGGGTIKLDGKDVVIPSKIGTDRDVQDLIEKEWEQHIKNISESMGDALGTFTEGFLAEAAQIAVPMASAALSATGVGAGVGAPVGAASVVKTGERLTRLYSNLINPTERAVKLLAPKFGTSAAAYVASRPVGTAIVTNTLENFLINTEDSIKERSKRAAVGAVIPAVPAVGKAAFSTLKHLGKVPAEVTEKVRMKEGLRAIVELNDMIGPEKAAEIVSGKAKVPTMKNTDPAETKALLEYMQTEPKNRFTSSQQIASAEVMRIVKKSGEDSPVIQHLDNFYTMSRGNNIKVEAATDAYKKTISQALPEVKGILEKDDHLHRELLLDPTADPVAIMRSRHPHSADVFESFYGRGKTSRRVDALIAVARVGVAPKLLDQMRQDVRNEIADLPPEHGQNRISLYNQIVDEVMPSIDKVRESYNKKQTEAHNLRVEIMGEVDGLLHGLKGAEKMKQEWIKAKEMIASNPLVDFRTLPEFRVARRLADRVAASKLRSKTKTMEGQFVKDRLSSLSENMKKYDRLSLDMEADMSTITNVMRDDILVGRTKAFNISSSEAARPSLTQRAVDQLANPQYSEEMVKEITRKMLTEVSSNKALKNLTIANTPFHEVLEAGINTLAEDITESAFSTSVRALPILRSVVDAATTELEPTGKSHPSLSGLKQVLSVAEAMEADNVVVEKMKTQLGTGEVSSIVTMLPTLGALADTASTYAGITKAAGVLAIAKSRFQEHMSQISKELSLEGGAGRFDHIFDLLAGDLRTRIRQKKDPDIPISADVAIKQMFDAADILSAKTVKEIMGTFKQTLGMDLDIEVFLSQFVTADNLYGNNAIFQSRLADINKYSAAWEKWKAYKKSLGGVSGISAKWFANTEMMNQIMMTTAPVMDGIEIEQYAGGIKIARDETTRTFRNELDFIERLALGKWGDRRVSDASNLIFGLDGMDKVGFFFRNSLEEGLVQTPAGRLLGEMYSNNSLAVYSTDAVQYTKKYVSLMHVDNAKQVYHSQISSWQKLLVGKLADKDGSIDPEIKRIILDTDEDGVPPILRYLSKHEVFANKDFADPEIWASAWEMVKYDAAVRRKLFGMQNGIYAEERESHAHLGVQIHNHKWRERFVTQRTTKEALVDDSSDRLYDRFYNQEDMSYRFGSTDDGQLAKTTGLTLRDPASMVGNPLLTLVDDLMIGMMAARTSHSKEFLRQRGILLQNLGWGQVSEWIKLYYQRDLKIKGMGDTVDRIKQTITRAGQGEKTPALVRGVRLALPAVGATVGWHLPFMALSRPLSVFVRQPLQQVTTAIVTSGPRNIEGELTNPLKVYTGFWGRTVGRMFKSRLYGDDLKKFYSHLPANYRDGMAKALSLFRDASDMRRNQDMKVLLAGQSSAGGLVSAAYGTRKLSSVTVDFLNKHLKENSETAMTSIQVEIGGNVHRRIVEQAIEMRKLGKSEGQIRKELFEEYQDMFRSKTASELWDQMSRVVDDALGPNAPEILKGGAFVPSLVPFVTFFTTNSVTRFGTLANPVAVNSFRAIFPADLRFFAARFNNAYLGLGAVLPALRIMKQGGSNADYRGIEKITAMKRMWQSKFVGVPEQLNGSLSLFMTGASLYAIGSMMDGGIDLPFLEDEGLIKDEDQRGVYRRMLSYLYSPTKIVRETGKLIKPVSIFDERARGSTGSINTVDILIPQEVTAAYHGLKRLSNAALVAGDNPEHGPLKGLGFNSDYSRAFSDWEAAKAEGNPKVIEEAYARMSSEYNKYAMQKGGALLNYALTTITPLQYVYRALPFDIIRWSHLCETEMRLYNDTLIKTDVINSPKYYSEYREILGMLGVAESAPFATKVGAITNLIYSTMRKNGEIGEEQEEYYGEHIRSLLRMLDERDYSTFLGLSTGFIPEKKVDEESLKALIKRKQYSHEMDKPVHYETGVEPEDYDVREVFKDVVRKRLGKEIR